MGLKSGYGDGYLTDTFPVGQLANAQLYDPTPEQHHGLGQVVRDQRGQEWTYVVAHAAIAADGTVALANYTEPNSGATITNGTTAAGATHTAKAAFAIGEYGWVLKN